MRAGIAGLAALLAAAGTTAVVLLRMRAEQGEPRPRIVVVTALSEPSAA